MSIRFLGVQIANGYSSEARVFAGLLAGTNHAEIEAHVLHHQWQGDRQSARQFQQASGAALQTLDFGWRSMAPDRLISAKAKARLQFLAALPRAAALGRTIAPDVIYSCQQLWDCQAATFLARRYKKPQVVHLHYIIGPWLHKPVLQRLLTCDHVIAVSDFIRDEALRHGVSPDQVTTIRNGIDVLALPGPDVRLAVRRELGIAPEAPLLGIVARLDPDKGQADTLRAFAVLLKKQPGARLVVIGSETPWHPGYADQLKSLAGQLGLTDAALFLGQRSDIPHLLAAMDVFVHPTRKDPCPLALLEASAAGLPVLAYAEGGANEIVDHGVTGLLSPPGQGEALTTNMETLLEDSALGRQMGLAGRERMAQQFHPQERSRQFLRVLEKVRAS